MTAASTAHSGGRLAGRRILIVGAGQQDHGLEDPPIGNGRAMSVLFAREGAALALADIDENSLQATEALVRDEGADCVTILADAAAESGVQAMFERGAAALSGLDGVVMNVGVGAGRVTAAINAGRGHAR